VGAEPGPGPAGGGAVLGGFVERGDGLLEVLDSWLAQARLRPEYGFKGVAQACGCAGEVGRGDCADGIMTCFVIARMLCI
jgi:hypothetical protein